MKYEITKGFFSKMFGLKVDGKTVLKNKNMSIYALNSTNSQKSNSDSYLAVFNMVNNRKLCSIYSTKEKKYILENLKEKDYVLIEDEVLYNISYTENMTRNYPIKGIITNYQGKPCYIGNNNLYTGNFDRIEVERYDSAGYHVYAVDNKGKIKSLHKSEKYNFSGISSSIFLSTIEKPGQKIYGIFSVKKLEDLINKKEGHKINAKFLKTWIDSYFEKLVDLYPKKVEQYTNERENFYKKFFAHMDNLIKNYNENPSADIKEHTKLTNLIDEIGKIEDVKQKSQFPMDFNSSDKKSNKENQKVDIKKSAPKKKEVSLSK